MTSTKPSRSLQGWKFKEWLFGNGSTIKEFLKVGIPALIGWVATNNPELTVMATLFGKFVLDTAEYYLKERT
jgi:hypothetical protein